MHKFLFLLIIAFLLFSCNLNFTLVDKKTSSSNEGYSMTPYKKSYGDGHYAGATFDLDSAQRDKIQIRTGLEKMKALNMNTVTIYGFEDESKDLRDYIFSELKRLGMRIVIRIERYDAESFAFTKSDAKKVLESHYDILEYISSSERKGELQSI